LIREGVSHVTRYEPTMDKVMRLHSVSSTIENGFVLIPTEAEWLGEYLQELATFPKGKHDDQADSTSQALDWARNGMPTYPVYEYMRRQALERGIALDPWLLDDDLLVAEGEPVNCSGCGNSGPAQYGRRYHCNQCGHEWTDIRYWRQELSIHRCEVNGEILVWDDGRKVWVNTVSGGRYPAGDDEEAA
jgi:hypothetical protein